MMSLFSKSKTAALMLSQQLHGQHRFIASATRPLQMSLDEFRDSVDREKRSQEPVGRSWSVRELRRKSYDDLHKLWHVLYKEKNMLLTESQLSQRHSIMMPQPERMQKVKKSMGAIRHVLGERKRETLANVAAKRAAQEQAMMEEAASTTTEAIEK